MLPGQHTLSVRFSPDRSRFGSTMKGNAAMKIISFLNPFSCNIWQAKFIVGEQEDLAAAIWNAFVDGL
jgi:hypothetical protein